MGEVMKKRIKQCPHCGSDYGLYSKEYVRYDQYYKFDGTEDGYGEFGQLDQSIHRKSTPVYCLHCDKRVTTLEQLKPRY